MLDDKKILAIIPARGGSKRLPGKNSKLLAGKPLIQWTIEAALQSKFLDTVVVSTDDEKIDRLAKSCGAEVPFLRPHNLSQDDSSSIDVALHALDFYKSLGRNFDFVMLLQPTSPQRKTKRIDGAIRYMIDKKADAVISVCPMEHSPLWTNTLPDNCSMEQFLDSNIINKRSQELSQYYRLNGAIYLVNVKRLLEENTFFIKNNIFAYKMETLESIDIDNEIDFQLAELIIKNNITSVK